MRAVPPGSFTLSEYLPGRDYCVQCLWDKGTLVLAKMAERITYLENGGPSGVSSTPALAKTAFNPRVIEVCRKAIRALDPNASGVFFVDIKESDQRQPCITEINAGRFATITNIHDLTGNHNMAVTFMRLALGERIRIRNARDFAKGYYLVRSVDTLPAVISEDELYEGIRDADRGASDQAAVARIVSSYITRKADWPGIHGL
jgi:carbamoyl-phosphate synthase large subunit